MTLGRFWINQPSTLQPLHKWHGVNVIAPINDGRDWCYAYFTSGNTISMQVSRLELSPGWRPSNALNNERTISVDANCVSHVRWIELPTLNYSVGGEAFTTTREDEFDYRLRCEDREVQPSKIGFWRYMLAKKHLVELL